MYLFALFFAFALSQEAEPSTGADGVVALPEEWLVGASYDEQWDRQRSLFHVQRLDESTIGLDSVLQAKLFEANGDIFIGTSMYNNFVTYKGTMPILKWDNDEETFSQVSSHPDLRGSLDAQAAVSYFTTADGNVWAFDSLFAIQNNTVRSTALIGGNGSSYILKWDSSSETFSSTPALVLSTNFSTTRSSFFTTSDNREFLWTFSWGPANPPSPIPGARNPVVSDNRAANPQKCSLIEYKSGSWVIAEDNFIGCPSRPRSPISFQNVNSNFVYLFPSFDTAGGVLTLNYRPDKTPQWEVTTDVLDGFAIPEADTLYHWVDTFNGVSYDMITATTPSAVKTYRLHWDTHFVEELPAVNVRQGAPYDFSWVSPSGRQCFVIGSASYPGLDLTPQDIYNWYTSIFCWDQSRDVFDLAIRIPAEYAWFNQVFNDADEDTGSYYLATIHKQHVTKSSMKIYHLWDRDSDSVHIDFTEGPSVSLEEQTRNDVDDIYDLSIAHVSLAAFTVLLVLITLFLTVTKG